MLAIGVSQVRLQRWHEKLVEAEETLHFVLAWPRRVSTVLFPAQETWYLTAIVILMIFVDTLCIMLSRDGNKEFAALSFANQVIASINQAVSVRNAGFAVTALDRFVARPAFFLVQLAMMFIQQYPVIVIMRNTNLYLERSVGIYREDITYTDLLRKESHPSITRRLARRFGRDE